MAKIIRIKVLVNDLFSCQSTSERLPFSWFGINPFTHLDKGGQNAHPKSPLFQKYLEKIFTEAISEPDIVALSIATRPDCLGNNVLGLLEKLNKIKPVWVELGLQTIHEKSADYIRRMYPLTVYDSAVENLHKIGVNVITHLILGLPGESHDDMLDSVRYVSSIPGLFGMKLHLLNIVKGSQMEYLYPDYQPFASIEEYVNLVVECLEIIPPDVTIHRLTGDAPRSILINPPWSFNKRTILNGIDDRMHLLDTWQGKYAESR